MSDHVSIRRRGVRSVEIGARILAAIAAARGPATLKSIAAAAAVPPAKCHRYLVSLGGAGLIEQDAASGRYDLGPGALELGLAALGRLDAVRIALPVLARLRDEIDETVVLAIWGNRGPTVIRLEESTQPVTLNLRVGSVLPLGRTAIGRVFAAHLPASITAPIRAAERRSEAGARRPGPDRFEAALAETRRRGLGRVVGELLPGVAVIAAPVFDAQGGIVAVIAALGRQESFDWRWNGPLARGLRTAARAISRRLGHAPDRAPNRASS